MDRSGLLLLSVSVPCVVSPEFSTSVLVIHRSNSSSHQAKNTASACGYLDKAQDDENKGLTFLSHNLTCFLTCWGYYHYLAYKQLSSSTFLYVHLYILLYNITAHPASYQNFDILHLNIPFPDLEKHPLVMLTSTLNAAVMIMFLDSRFFILSLFLLCILPLWSPFL